MKRTTCERGMQTCLWLTAAFLLFTLRPGMAQAPETPLRIGILANRTIPQGSDKVVASFKNAMTRLGYTEGGKVVYEQRTAASSAYPTLASELVQANVRVLVAAGSTEALTLMQATSTIPIVFWSADPVAEGLVKTLQRPGKNATGIVAVSNGIADQLGFLRMLVPGATRIAILNNPSYAPGRGVLQRTQDLADSLGFHVQNISVQSADDLPDAFASAEQNGAQAVLVTNHGMFRSAASRVAQLALDHHLPLFSPYVELTEAGALFTWIPSFIAWSERAASYVDRILKGADPATLPVEASIPFLYTINVRTARAMGLSAPDTLLRSVNQVIR